MAWNVCLAVDNEAIQHLFSRTFDNREDISLRFCDTAEETIREVEQNPPHLLIISINLPDKDGYELCGELKDKGVSFPILLIEDIFEDIDLDRCLEVRTDGFIAKPFEEDLIAEKVDEVLGAETQEEAPAPEPKPAPEAAEEPIGEEVGEETEEAAPGVAYEEEESPVTELAGTDEEEGIVELTDVIMQGEEEPTLEEVFIEEGEEEEEVPPAIATALEESASELAKMEAMEEGAPTPEPTPEPEPVQEEEEVLPAAAVAMPSAAPGLEKEEIEAIIGEVVERKVEETLREKLPGILKESLAHLFSELSGSLK